MANDNSQNRVAASISIDTSKLRESLQQANQAVKEFRDQLNQSSGNTFIQSADGAVRNLQQAIRELQLQFKEGTIAADEYVKSLEGLRKTYASALDTKTPIGVINDQALRNAIVQAQNVLTRYYDFQFTSEKRLAEQEQQAKEAAIENELRIIKERYSVQLDTAQTTLQKLKKLMDEESAYFEANELKKIEAIKMMNKAQADLAAQQEQKWQMQTAGNPLGSFGERAMGMAAGLAIFQMIDALAQIPQSAAAAQSSLVKLKQVLELTPSQADIQRFGSLDGMLKQLEQTASIMAQTYGVDINQVLDAMSLVGRKFKDVAEIVTATDTALQLYTVDNVQVEDAVRGVEALMSQFGLSMNQARQALFQITAASHAFQVTASDLLGAIERSGSSFKVLKANSAEAVAAISTMAQLTAQAGRTIGNAWKSIEASMTSDKGVKALHQLGIEAFDAEGNMKDFADILAQLQTIWPKLSDAAKMHFAEVLAGGKYQYERLMTFLNDYSQQYQRALAVIKQADQDLQNKLVETAMESPSKQWDMTRASLENLALVIMQKATPALIAFLTDVRKGTNYIAEHWGSIEQWLEKGAKLAEAYVGWRIGLSTWNALVKLGTTQQLAFNSALTMGSTATNTFGAAVEKAGFSLTTFTANIMAALGKLTLLTAAYQIFLDLTGQNTEGLLQSKLNALEEMKNDHTSAGQGLKDLLSLDFPALANDIWIQTKYGVYDLLPFPTQGMKDARNNAIQSEIDKVKSQLKQIQDQKSAQQQQEIKQSMDQMNKIIQDSLKTIDKQVGGNPPPPPPSGDWNPDTGSGSGKKKSSSSSTGFTGPYSNLINKAAEQYGIDPNFLAAVLMQESGLNPYNANGTIKVSPAGAIGIAQFMPGTARALGVNPYDTTSSIYGAAKYLKNLLNQFGSMDLAAAAFNAGPGNVSKYGGIPPFAETQRYVKAVDAFYRQFSNGQSLSGGSFTSQFTDQYKDYVDQLENSLGTLVQRNKELDATISNLTTQQQNFADLLKYGATNADIASQSTDVYSQKLISLKMGQESLHETNNAIRTDMAQIQQKIHDLNPNNAPLSSLSQGTSEAIQTLQQEYDKLSQQADENGKKWWEYQKNITQSTLDWLNVIYQLQDNGLVPLSNQLKQNDTELKTLQSDMNAASNDLKNNINDTQALTKYLSDYHKEVVLLNAQNSILNSENEQLQSNNENLRSQMEYINQLHEKGLLTVEAYDAALQSLNNQIEKNNESLAQNTQQITQNVQTMKSAANDIRSMIIENLKNAYDAERQYEEQLLQNTFDAQQKSIQNMLDSMTSSLDAQIKALQDQKDAIDKKISDLEQQWSNQDATNKLADLQNQLAQVESQKNQQIIDASGNVTYTYDMQQAVDLQKQITDQETQMKRDAQKQQLQDQANALDAQIKNLQDYEQQQKDYYQQQLQDLQDNYDQQKAKLDAFWQDKLSTDKLNTEADNLILKNGYDDALKNTIDFANKMKEQFASIQSAAIAAGQAVANSMGAMYASTYTPSSSTSTTTSSGTSTSSSSNRTSSSSSTTWSSGMTVSNSHGTYTIPSGLSGSAAAAYAAAIQAGGVPLSSTAKMATGGYVPPGKEGFAYLHENEVVINSDLTNRLREVLYNVPKLSVPSVSSHSITQTFHIDKLEFPNVRTAADAKEFTRYLANFAKQAYFNARAGAMS